MINRRNFITQSGLGALGCTLEWKTGILQLQNIGIEPAGTPCRNFNILATCAVTDPLDQKDKLVLSNFAESEIGSIIFIDPQTGKGEQHVLPAGAGAWGLVNWHNEKLIIGTCTGQAYLHVFDLRRRQFEEPIESKNEAYFWQMALGSDDKVYSGTYPGCTLTRFDPKTRAFVNLGKVSDNPKNLYSRNVYCQAAGYVFIWYGFDSSGVKLYDIAKETISDFGNPGDKIREVNARFICLENENKLFFYDARTLQPVENHASELSPTSITLANGQHVGYTPIGHNLIGGVRGQDYFITELPKQQSDYTLPAKIHLQKIPVDPLPTAIFSLTTDQKGTIWGSCAFGQTIFSFDPKTNKYWNSSGVCDKGGEVYGMVFHKNKLFLSAYAGGDHIVYDPQAPWNQLENINPKTLTPVGPELIRPEGRSVTGPDGNIWTGWSAKYGTYGGGLSSVNPVTYEVKSWYDPIPQQQVAGIAADKKYIYFTTNGGASGLGYNKEVICHLGVWEPGKGLIHSLAMDKEITLNGAIIATGKKIAFGMKNSVALFDPQLLKIVKTIPLDTDRSCGRMIDLGKNMLGVFCGNKYFELDLDKEKVRSVVDLPGTAGAATVTASGQVYFSVKSKLYKLKRTI